MIHYHYHHQSTAVEIAETMSHHRGLFAIARASSFRPRPGSLAKMSEFRERSVSPPWLGQGSLHSSRSEITWSLARKQWPANFALLRATVFKIGGSSP